MEPLRLPGEEEGYTAYDKEFFSLEDGAKGYCQIWVQICITRKNGQQALAVLQPALIDKPFVLPFLQARFNSAA